MPFTGASGQLLDATLEGVGLRRKDVYVTNAVGCRPTKEGKDAPPSAAMLEACTPRLVEELRQRHPRVIVAMGATASQRLLHTKDGIGKVQGVLQWSEEMAAWVLPTYHPAAVLHGGQGFFDDIYRSLERVRHLTEGTVPFPDKEYKVAWTYLQDGKEIDHLLQRILERAGQRELEVSLDTESHGPFDQPRPGEDTWDMFQVTIGPRNEDPWHTYSCRVQDVDFSRNLMKALLLHSNIWWDFHNLSYDFQVLQAEIGAVPPNADCTMALALCLTERGEQVGLKALSRQYLNAPYYEQGLPGNIFRTGPQTPAQWLAEARYGAYDAFNTRALRPILRRLAQEVEKNYQLYVNILLPAQRAFAIDEAHGAEIDLEYAQEIEKEWLPEIQHTEASIQRYAKMQGFPRDPKVVPETEVGVPCPECVPEWAAQKLIGSGKPRTQWRELMNTHTTIADGSCSKCYKRRYIINRVREGKLNPRSPKQLQHLAFDILDMEMPGGRRSCDAEFLDVNQGRPFAKMLFDLREKDGLLRHYVYGIVDDVWSDGRVHPDFLLFGTRSGRLAVHNPPVQTLPKWQVNPKLAKMTRKLFRGTTARKVDGIWYLIVEADYSAIELYTAANETHDMALYKALTDVIPELGRADFHRHAASAMFGKPLMEVSGTDRFNSKFVTYGVGYGRQAYSLAIGELEELTGGDVDKAQGYIDALWKRFPDWKRGRDEWERMALEEGEITTCFGRKRRWRLVTPELVKGIRNQAASHVPQSVASDICLMAVTRLSHRLPEEGLGHVLFPVHDSIVTEIREDRLDEGIALMVKEMTTTPEQIWVKLSVDVQVGPSLGEVEDYKLEVA